MHPYWCSQQSLNLSYVLRILLGKFNLSPTLPSVLDSDVPPRLLFPVGKNLRSKCFTFHSSAAGRAFPSFPHTPFSLTSLDIRNCRELWLFPLGWQTRFYLPDICAGAVWWQKANPQAIQPLHLPAWTEFPHLCLLSGVEQVLGWESSWEMQRLQRGAEMGSSCLTTTEGILATHHPDSLF